MQSSDSIDPSSTIAPGGDYEYLGEGYYACLEAEVLDAPVTPSIADALDAYVVPIALSRVHLSGLPVPSWYLTNGPFKPPAILYGVNPFARNHVVVNAGDDARAAARKVSRQGKFVVCCQELPADATIVTFEQVFGRSVDAAYAGWAEALYGLFHLPLARVRLIETPDGALFSAVERLPEAELSDAARALLATSLSEREDRRG